MPETDAGVYVQAVDHPALNLPQYILFAAKLQYVAPVPETEAMQTLVY